MSKILFFDLETSGLSREKDEILNIAAMVYNEDTGKIECEFNEFCKPSKPIPFYITQLTGISNAQVRDCWSEGVVLNQFMQWVELVHCDKVCGHNIKAFDTKWIGDKCRKYTIENVMPTEVLDTLDMAKAAYKAGSLPGYNYTTERGNLSFKQEHLMDYYHLGTQEHLAITDVQYDVMIYQRFKEAEEQIDYGF